MAPEHREEMRILDLRIPSPLMSDSNIDSDDTEESSITLEGYYAIDWDEDKIDQPTVTTDGHEGQINSDNLDRQFKNISVSDINQNIVAMEVDCQGAASTTRSIQSTKEMRPSTSNPIPPVEQLEDTLDFEVDSEAE